MSALETVDLEGVEILKIGGPVHGRGSPVGGDYFTTDDLRALAAADTELGDEITPPARLGHGQGDPAVGWVENVRLNDDGSRLLADVWRVPKKVAELIRAGAYRSRSVELGGFTSQRTGRRYDQIVRGLAFVGGRMPAVAGLADIERLYAAQTEVVRVYEFAPTERSNNVMAIDLIDRALEEGRIDVAAANAWVRNFELDASLTTRMLQGLPPDRRQAVRNWHALTTVDASLETDEEAAAYRRSFEAMHGGESTRELSSDDSDATDFQRRFGAKAMF